MKNQKKQKKSKINMAEQNLSTDKKELKATKHIKTYDGMYGNQSEVEQSKAKNPFKYDQDSSKMDTKSIKDKYKADTKKMSKEYKGFENTIEGDGAQKADWKNKVIQNTDNSKMDKNKMSDHDALTHSSTYEDHAKKKEKKAKLNKNKNVENFQDFISRTDGGAKK